MRKINFTKDILPHLVAVVVFLLVTVIFFSPVFFKHQSLNQHDITQSMGMAKQIKDFRTQTGQEGLWAENAFSGMPAYLISVQWSNGIVSGFKQILGLWLPHPVTNIFLAFVCYYIMLLAFRVRPFIAIVGALAFGLSSFLIIGLSAGHNGRIGASAFIPLVIAGVHLAFSGKRFLGSAVAALGFALHLRENHLQMTYYLAIMLVVYGVIELISAIREKRIIPFSLTVVSLVSAILIAIGTFFGQFWAITEYTNYSMRGTSSLVKPGEVKAAKGLDRDYAFMYKFGLGEPMNMLIPEYYGGSSMAAFVQDPKSDSYRSLSSMQDNQLANQLASSSVHYFGPQEFTAGPYYAGAIMIFLFVVGILFAEKKYVIWLCTISVISIFLAWGDSFSSLNYFLFDHLPGYNKFRSFSFALFIAFTAVPFLGMLGLEKLASKEIDKADKKKLLIALAVVGGICLLTILFGGMRNYLKESELSLPAAFTKALESDRAGLVRGDAFRSLIFVGLAFALIYFEAWKRISAFVAFGVLALLTVIDLAVVDKRYFTASNYQRTRENQELSLNDADKAILNDKGYYRVYNLNGTMAEARTSYYHNSIGGYHGAKMRNYQDLYDSCIVKETNALIKDAQGGTLDFGKYHTLNMLNIKYVVYGPGADNVIPNPSANGPAWFVDSIAAVKTGNDEIKLTGSLNTRKVAVINETKFKAPSISTDTAHTITLAEHKLNYLKYESQAAADGLAVFSEIYYPLGWTAAIDGKPTDILSANYVLRAVAIPAGKHTIEFRFEPKAYVVGNKITLASSWALLLLVLGSFGYSLRKQGE